MNLNEVLSQLDPGADGNWTSDGLPRMDAVIELTGNGTLTRKQVTDAYPGLTRDVAAVLHEEDGAVDEVAADPSAVEPVAEPEQHAIASEYEDPIHGGAEEDEQEEPIQEEPIDVLSLPIGDVFGSPELTEMAIDAISAQVASKLQIMKEVEAELQQLYTKSEVLARVKMQQDRRLRSTGQKTTNVQDYLASQKRSRADRAARAQRFIDAGTSAKDVAAQLQSKSPLDAALAQRRPSPGTGRPAVRTPQR